MPEWSPELTVDRRLARRLISAQCFTPHSLEPLGEGWDNTVWLVDGRWAFRFPRRAIAVPGVEREIAVLGELAPQLPLPVPEPRFVGEPSDEFPWPFSGAELIPGTELPDAAPTDDERSALGRPLGEFLRALHDSAVTSQLPADPMGRSDMAARVPRTAALLREVEPLWTAPPSVLEALAAASRLPPVAASRVVHGDLHVRHLLLHRGTLSGVIDWGDVCRGDPSMDLAICWSALTPEGSADFFAAYGRVSEATLLRARVLSLFMCAALAVYATGDGRDRLALEALAGLARSA